MDIMDYIPQFGGALGGRTQDLSGIPQDDTLQQLMLKRKLAQAEALRNAEVPQGQMVSGRYVPPSWTQYLANAVGKYQGAKQEREALKQFGEYQKGKQAKYAEALADYEKSLKRTPEVQQGTFEIQKPVTQTQVQTSPYGTTEQLGATSPWTNNQVEGMQTVQVPMATTTMRQPTAADRYASLLKFAGATNNPELTQRAMIGALEQANRAEETAGERAWKEKETAGERAWREQQTKNEQEFTRIRDKERNNQELTMAEKRFANEYALQKSRQGFEAGENALNRANAIKIHSMTNAGGKPTEFQEKAGLYAKSMNQASKTLNDLETKGVNVAPTYGEAVFDESSRAGQIGLSQVRSPERKSYVQAQKQWIDSINRVRSGANLPEIEYNRAVTTFFPSVNDGPAEIEQKRIARQQEESAMQSAAGNAWTRSQPISNQPAPAQSVDYFSQYGLTPSKGKK